MRLPLTLSLPEADPSAPSTSTSTFIIDGELVLIELQGELELEGQHGPDGSHAADRHGARVGKLDLSVPGRPVLMISHHKLLGKFVNLNTPIAILKHTLPPSSSSTSKRSRRLLQTDHPPTSSPLKRPLPTEDDEDDTDDDDDEETGPENVAELASVNKRQNTGPAGNNGAAAPDSHLLQTPGPKDASHTAGSRELHQNKSNGRALPLSSSPLPLPPSSAITDTTPKPQTPLNVTQLKKGKHEIVGILKRKLVFSKRPEPVVRLEQASDEE